MRQNFGLLLLTVGSLLLSMRVFLEKSISSWKDLPWEQRIFYHLLGRKSFWEKFNNQNEAISKISDVGFRKKMGRFYRFIEDLPIFAFAMMVAGFFLSLNYAAIFRFFH